MCGGHDRGDDDDVGDGFVREEQWTQAWEGMLLLYCNYEAGNVMPPGGVLYISLYPAVSVCFAHNCFRGRDAICPSITTSNSRDRAATRGSFLWRSRRSLSALAIFRPQQKPFGAVIGWEFQTSKPPTTPHQLP